MKLTGIGVAVLAMVTVCAPAMAKKPSQNAAAATSQMPVSGKVTCGNPLGTWKNQMGSELKITKVDIATGAIQGEYRTSTGATGFYPLVGWINSAPPEPKMDNVVSISFTVRWNEIGSITAWTGTCVDSPTGSGIKALWHLSRPSSQFDWAHILAGSDSFAPL